MQPSTFRVTERDVQRGYVEIPGETPLEVRSNGRGTHLLVFDGILAEPGLLRGAEVRGLGRQARIDPPGGWIPIPTERGRGTFRLEWRFLLGEGARPGTYPWPYRLSARPL